ncbi:hemolysin family protein [Candidatus Woesearchaeota archaeon]|nr:hemolysin family protein [Candidatus Woesearchaeota archaeon]
MISSTQILLLIVFLILSAFFSGVETALFSLSRLRVKHLLEKKRRGAKTVDEIKSKPYRLLITILIGNNVVNIAAAALATTIAIEIFESNVIGITTGIMTLLILIFGEITPKTLATTYKEQIALVVAWPLKILMIVLYPIVKIFELFMKGIIKIIGKKEKPLVTEEEIKTFVKVGEEVGTIKEEEREMIHRIFKFDDMDVERIMTPKKDIVCIEENSTIKEAMNKLIKSGYSRLPTYRKLISHITGFIHVKDILKVLKENKGNIRVKELIRPIVFIPDTKKIDTLLDQFRNRRQHIAIVVDEYGAIRGLVTTEDILEEIVGEIVDETEKIKPFIKKIAPKKYLALGKTDIELINKRLKLRIKETEDFDTISGYILNRLGSIPKEGEKVKLKKSTITVAKVVDNRIEEVEILLRNFR